MPEPKLWELRRPPIGESIISKLKCLYLRQQATRQTFVPFRGALGHSTGGSAPSLRSVPISFAPRAPRRILSDEVRINFRTSGDPKWFIHRCLPSLNLGCSMAPDPS